jgi:hypothetical protein
MQSNKSWAIAVIVLMLCGIAIVTASVSSTRFGLTETNNAEDGNEGLTPSCGSPAQSTRHVLIVVSDGMRADVMESWNHPVIGALTTVAFYTRGRTQPGQNGRQIEHGTNENVAAIISGKPLHNIYGTGSGLLAEGYPAPGKPLPKEIDTLFELANRRQFRTGFVYSKAKASSIINPDARQINHVRGSNSRDDGHARNRAIEFVKANAGRKWFLLVWFSEPDYVQVAATNAYRTSVRRNLDFLASIVDIMKANCAYYDSVIGLTADHGMSDDNGHHGTRYWNDPRVYEVPWLVAAPGSSLVHKGNGAHYNHELAATVSHVAWGALPYNSDSIVWLESQGPPHEHQTRAAFRPPKHSTAGIH